MRRFAEAGISPKTRFGQNFLVDANLVRLLHRSAKLARDDVVLEVGTGTGSLTAMMAADAAHVVTVEIDADLAQLAREQLAEVDNVTLMEVDALKNKNHLNPAVLAAVAQQLNAADENACTKGESPGIDTTSRVFKVVANLPYNVATPIITNALACELPPRSLTVTIQKELADRIVAPPNCKDYGSLSVWIQCQCRAEIIRVMPPTVFWPRPKVSSAIIHIERDDALRGRITDLAFFHRFVRSVFMHRRKFLRTVLINAFKQQLSKGEIDGVLEDQSLGPDARTEQLSVERIMALADAVRSRLPVV